MILKRISLLMAVVFSLSITMPVYAAQQQLEYETVIVTANRGLNVRQSPGMNGTIVGSVAHGTELILVESSHVEGWSVVLHEGVERYVCEDFIVKQNKVVTLSQIENKVETVQEIVQVVAISPTVALYEPGEFKFKGVIHWGGWRWTYYSERILPGGGLKIPGRHTDMLGYVRDGEGYICLASNDLAKGTVVDTPFGGLGKVYDCGCPSGTLDVYVGW